MASGHQWVRWKGLYYNIQLFCGFSLFFLSLNIYVTTTRCIDLHHEIWTVNRKNYAETLITVKKGMQFTRDLFVNSFIEKSLKLTKYTLYYPYCICQLLHWSTCSLNVCLLCSIYLYGSLPFQNRKNKGRWRFVTFISMTPAIWANDEDIRKHQHAYQTVALTTHWSSQVGVFFLKLV